MKVTPSELPDVLVIEPDVYPDERGFFLETYSSRRFREAGIEAQFVQDNHTFSVRNVLRGLHYQVRQPQGKLVAVMAGEIFDVAVDLRRSSPSFGRWTGITLSGGGHRMMWIPQGFAHGYLVLSEHAIVLYKTTSFYAPQHERVIRWNDPDLGIQWPLEADPIVSEKDRRGVLFRAAETFD